MFPAGSSVNNQPTVFEAGQLNTQVTLKKILIVEDDHFSQKLFEKIVHDVYPEYTVLFAANGHEAQLALVRHEGIQLAILDIYLSEGPSGIEIYRHCIKKRDWQIPMLLTSAISERQLSELLGADVPMPVFLKKPFRLEVCMALIKSILNKELPT